MSFKITIKNESMSFKINKIECNNAKKAFGV
jgi:hypothetical protein